MSQEIAIKANLRKRIGRQILDEIVPFQELEIGGADDNKVLAWAAQAERLLLTHDQRTLPKYAYERIRKGHAVAGVIVVKHTLPFWSAIEHILLVAKVTSVAEWVNQLQCLPQ